MKKRTISKEAEQRIKNLYDKNVIALSENFNELQDECDSKIAVMQKTIDEHKAEVGKYLGGQDATIEAIRKRHFNFFYDRTQALADHLGLWFAFQPETPAVEAKEKLEPKPGSLIPIPNTEKPHTFMYIITVSIVSCVIGFALGMAASKGII